MYQSVFWLEKSVYINSNNHQRVQRVHTCLFQQGVNRALEVVQGAEMAQAASSAPSVPYAHSKFEHVAGTLADPKANPPRKRSTN